MSLTGQTNLDTVNQLVDAVLADIFRDRPEGHYAKFTGIIPAHGSQQVLLPVLGGDPELREWVGARQVGGLRTYLQTVTLTAWEKTIGIPLEYFRGDMHGLIGAQVRAFLESQRDCYDKIVMEALVANTATGYDGIALISASHTNVGTGGTSDNDVGGALGYANLRSADQMLGEMMDEAGEPLQRVGRLLVVGTSQKEMALQITGSNKAVTINDSGEPAHSSGEHSQLLPNYVGGAFDVAVSSRIVDDSWFLFDTGRAAKPCYLAEFSKVEGVVKDKPEDDNVFMNREVLVGIHFDATYAVGDWHCAAGDIA